MQDRLCHANSKSLYILSDFYGRDKVSRTCSALSEIKKNKTESVQNMLCPTNRNINIKATEYVYILSDLYGTEKVCRTHSGLSIAKISRLRECRTSQN